MLQQVQMKDFMFTKVTDSSENNAFIDWQTKQ